MPSCSERGARRIPRSFPAQRPHQVLRAARLAWRAVFRSRQRHDDPRISPAEEGLKVRPEVLHCQQQDAGRPGTQHWGLEARPCARADELQVRPCNPCGRASFANAHCLAHRGLSRTKTRKDKRKERAATPAAMVRTLRLFASLAAPSRPRIGKSGKRVEFRP